MIRKLIGIFIVMLLVGIAVLPVVNSYEKNFFNYNLNEESHDDCKCMSYIDSIGCGLYVMSDPLVPPSNIEDYIIPSSKVDLPEYFNWKDHNESDWTTPAKDQGFCGSCWIFASVAIIESVINIREGCAELDPDLSEQYVLSCLPEAGFGCNGGFPYEVFSYIMDTSSSGNNCNGIICESCFPYQASDSIDCGDKCPDWEDYLIPIKDHGYWITDESSQGIEDIKLQIMQGGPVVACMLYTNSINTWGFSNHDPSDYYPNNGGDYGMDHDIVVIGWKDDPSINMGGYWICKNSFGTYFGYDGFFNLEYGLLGSLYIDDDPDTTYIVFVDYDPESYDWEPVTKANGPYYGLTSEPVQFTGSAPCRVTPLIWEWDFGDGETSNEQNPSHQYTSPGEYAVTLTVTDGIGGISSDTTNAWIQETNTPPNIPTIEGPTKVRRGKPCWYNISTTDPDGTHFYIYVNVYNIEYGVWWGPYESGEVDHNYWHWKEEGDYIVKAKAKDPYSAESDWATLEVTVSKNKVRSQFDFIMERLIQRFLILESLL